MTIRGPSKAVFGDKSNEGELECVQVVRLETELSVLGTGLPAHVGSSEPWKHLTLPMHAGKDL